MGSSLADNCAHSNLWGWKNFQVAGFLRMISSCINHNSAANKITVNILGAFRATFSGMSPKNKVISCFIYVSDSVTGIFLSYETIVDLLINNSDFPTIGYQLRHQHS